MHTKMLSMQNYKQITFKKPCKNMRKILIMTTPCRLSKLSKLETFQEYNYVPLSIS